MDLTDPLQRWTQNLICKKGRRKFMFKLFYKKDGDTTKFYFQANFNFDVVVSAVIIELIKQFLNI